MKHLLVLSLLAAMVFAAGRTYAQDKSYNDNATGFRKELLADFQDIQKKYVDLADAIPAETYAWRPMDGVRSVSEVFMHIALDNYNFPKMVGVNPPEGISRDMEKTVVEKKKVIYILKQSFDHFENAVGQVSDTDMDKATKMFGKETTQRDVLLNAVTHMHEHLGQMIAYARMNKIVPPWTAEREAAAKKK